MRAILLALIALPALATAQSDNSLALGNDAWPPFIVDGPQQGISEKLVCEALDRAGRSCRIVVQDWDEVLKEAEAGTLDGIAAAWKTPEREGYLLFSEPYLTNRIVPMVAAGDPAPPASVADLAGKRVAMVPGYAYGEAIDAARATFEMVPASGSAEAVRAVQEDRADVALIDELVARALEEAGTTPGVEPAGTVLAYRELHFAVSRKHPEAEAILADFHRTYELMLRDGAVNEALGVDWLATDLGDDGKLDLVVRQGVSFDDLDNPSKKGSAYALDQSQYRMMNSSNLEVDQVSYQVDGKSHSSLQSALVEMFGKDVVCEHQEYSSTFDCSKLFKR